MGTMTYADIRSALESAGWVVTREGMGGGVSALGIRLGDVDTVYVGNGEWTRGESESVPVEDGTVSVMADRDGEQVDIPDTAHGFIECDTVAAVVDAVLRAANALDNDGGAA